MLVTLALWGIATTLFMLGVFVLLLLPAGRESFVGVGLQLLGLVVLILNLIWATYFVTWFQSGDRLIVWKKTPRAFAASLALAVVLIPMIISGTALGLILILILFDMFQSMGNGIIPEVFQALGVVTVIALVWYLASMPLCSKIKSRVRRNAIERRVCYECGYDLHACVTPACPECGEPIPWLSEPEA